MAKELVTQVKLQVPAGSANPAPPVGPALGQHGLDIQGFCKQFNDRTKDTEKGLALPVIINVYQDRSFDFVIKSTPAAILLKKAAGIEKGCVWSGAICDAQDCSAITVQEDCVGNCSWTDDLCGDGIYPVPVDVIIDQTFEYTSSILNSDSLMFRINSDCNNDGVWTIAETYEDIGTDGCPDQYEDGNGGCVCNYPDDCTDDDIQTGDDPNIDNWQQGTSQEIYTENNDQYDCVAPYCNLEISQDSYRGEPFIDRLTNVFQVFL